MIVICRQPDAPLRALTLDGRESLPRFVEIPEVRHPPVGHLDEESPIAFVHYSGTHRFKLTEERGEHDAAIYDWLSLSWKKVTMGPLGHIISIEDLDELPKELSA